MNMNYRPMGVQELLNGIEKDKFALPAIQRSYVWNEKKIYGLFDSLLKGFPIGAFLFWEPSEKESEEFSFNKFIKNYDFEDDVAKGQEFKTDSNDFSGVLDGQQRITSLLIGLRGSYRANIKKSRWGEDALFPPKTFLAVNLLHDGLLVEDDEENANDGEYEFKFLTETEIKSTDEGKYWFKVSDIEKIKEIEVGRYPITNMKDYTAAEQDLACDILIKLFGAVMRDEILCYFTASNRTLNEVVEIFERVNNNGTPVSGIDLLLSMASAQRNKKDMQREIAEAIETIDSATGNSETSFHPDRSFIIVAGLMATGASSLSPRNRDNYRPNQLNSILDDWDEIIGAICNAAILIKDLGFDGKKLSKSYLHPIVYYLYKLGSSENVKRYIEGESEKSRADKDAITEWLIRAYVKQLFSYGTPGTLLAIRNVMDKCMKTKKTFPLDDLMKMSGKRSLVVTEDEAISMLRLKYNDPQVVPLLMMLLEAVPDKYEVDHMWPQAIMSSASAIKKHCGKISEEELRFYRSTYNDLPNLQLLRKIVNAKKNDKEYSHWLEAHFSDEERRAKYFEHCCIPRGVSLSFDNYKEVYTERKELLLERIIHLFDVEH